MVGKRKNLTGIKYPNTMLTFIEPKSDYKWLCKCDCGNTIITIPSNVKRGRTKSCGCLSPKLYPNTGEILGRYWSSTIRGAKKRNIEFNCDTNEVWRIFLDQKRQCNLTGLPLVFSSNAKNLSLGNASLDRIDNTKGYVSGNIQWIEKTVNIIKQNFDQKYLISVATLISEFDHIFTRQPPNIDLKLFQSYFNRLKQSASRRNIYFNIDINYIIDLYNKQFGQCNLSGQHIDLLNSNSTASLDRINSYDGYTIGNLQWVHKDINRMKLYYNQDYFLHICNLIHTKFNNTICIISGYFQVLHSGHINYIESASKYGSVYAIVNNDEQVKLKGSYNFLPESERLCLVSAIRGVEYSCLSIDRDRSVVLTLGKIRQEFPHHKLIFFNSGDRQANNCNIDEVEFCNNNNIQLIYDSGGKKINASSTILQNFLNRYWTNASVKFNSILVTNQSDKNCDGFINVK